MLLLEEVGSRINETEDDNESRSKEDFAGEKKGRLHFASTLRSPHQAFIEISPSMWPFRRASA